MLRVNGVSYFFFFFQAEDGIRDLTVTGVQTCALPIYARRERALVVVLDEHRIGVRHGRVELAEQLVFGARCDRVLDLFVDAYDLLAARGDAGLGGDRKSTRLNSSHSQISYAVFCLKKKK